MKTNNNYVIVSVGVWDDQGRFLMVEEEKEYVRGLWSLPSGRLELNETLIEGAKREVFEETRCKVEITGLCGIFHYQVENDKGMSVRFCFNSKLISWDKNAELEKEIISCQWKTKEEVTEMIKVGKIRSKSVESAIQEYFKGKNYPLDVLKEL